MCCVCAVSHSLISCFKIFAFHLYWSNLMDALILLLENNTKHSHFFALFSYLLQASYKWEKWDMHANQILVTQFCSHFPQTSPVSFSALYVPNKNTAFWSWCLVLFAVELAAPSWAFTTVSQLRCTQIPDLLWCVSQETERMKSG